MARPVKEGLDYFPLNVTLSGSIEYIQCMYGKMGEAVIISLWQKIYQKSYYVEYNERTPLVFSRDFGNQLEMLFGGAGKKNWEIYDEIVRKAVEFGVFDKELFEKFGILTSKKIQENYIFIKRKSKLVEIEKRYLLLSDVKKRVNAEETDINSAKTPIIESVIPQSKEKESKEKKIKLNNSIAEESSISSSASDICIKTYEKYIGLMTPNILEGIEFYIEKGMDAEVITRIIEYAAEQNKRSWQYISAALMGNLNAGVKTLDDYNKARADFAAEKEKEGKNNRSGRNKNKFHNYTDTNAGKTDYKALQEGFLKDMLDE